jgi:spore germination protein YaaH
MLSPLGKVINITNDKSYKVMAFLPNWSINKYTKMPEGLDEVVYWGNGAEKSKIKYNGKKILGIVKIINNEKVDYEKEYIDILKKINDSGKKWYGVNLDYEFNNNPTEVLEDEFLNFLEKLKNSIDLEIGVDIFVNTINKGSRERLERLFGLVDEVVIMAYDFHRPGAKFSGPVAPIEAPVGKRSILEMVQRIVYLGLPRDKIVIAFPLYGYEWKTYTADYGAQIIGNWYQVVSLKRAKKVKEEKGLVENWDDLSASPWMSFEENGEIRQMYYDNERSLKIKIDLVKQNGFKGVGFWALGYEDDIGLFKLLTND